MRHGRRLFVAATAALALAASGCAIGGDQSDRSDSGKTVVTFRLWDDQVAKAYEQSFAAFEKDNPTIDVQVDVIPWNDYWTKLTADVSSGNVSDIFWTNTSNFGIYADNGNLIDIDKELGDQKNAWKKSVVDLYTRDGKLWGVPQLWDSIALFYNKKLVKEAGVDPAALRWDPDVKNDTFLLAAKKLTLDFTGNSADQPRFKPVKIRQYGFNAALDSQAIVWDFVGSNGGTWQEGDEFAVNNPKTQQATQYVVDLINKHHVAPSAADTNENGDKSRDLFVQGKMAMFQSGPYNLKNIQENADFEWGLAPMLEGPAGRVGVVHGVAAVGSAKTKHLDETVKVLSWLGSAEGQRLIAEGGYAFPGVTAAEKGFVDYWSKQGVDLKPFQQAAEGTTFPAPVGPRVNAGATAMDPIMKEIFLGRTPVVKGLADAEKAGNDAIKE
ncbi:ABC transporter substrate-binding protein [Actinopolymorpha alba]|uniref:ABC transporter substrate-binding protein n=1 Tax=Actinopolymorpha alba TaxID=533267 RepID=UPI0003640E14|nr:sugar ABC transporter substrate-binding protein [Actinopolymorpha alba]